MSAIHRILVPVDFSPLSEAVLEQAIDLARRYDGQIDVLHVWSPPSFAPPDATIQETVDGPRTPLYQFVRSRAGRDMEQFLATAESRLGLDLVRGRLEAGDPSDAILHALSEGSYDLVVMGTHGRRGLSRLLLGSVAERVVRHAPCPVLTMRHAARARN